MPEFIGDEVEVHFARKPGPPTSFTWRQAEFTITRIISMQRALDFRKRWWQRRHRDYYEVETDSGETFKLYFNRGPGRRYWVLYERLTGTE